MQDRDVQVIITLKASQIEGTRRLFKALSKFPTVAWNHADQLPQVCEETNMNPEQMAAVAGVELGMKADSEFAESIRRELVPIFKTAVIHDPDGRKGRLQ